MTAPGLALFYGGMVRQKNALATLMQSFVVLCLVSIQWVLFGYSLAFGPDKGGLLGGLEFAGLRGVGAAPKAVGALTSVNGTRAGSTVNGVVSGTGWNRLYIAGAAALY